jgi:exosortase
MERRDWIWGAALLAVLAPAFVTLAGIWGSVDYYSHGFMVPLVSLWLAYARRKRLPAPGAHTQGVVALVAALALYGLGLLLQDPTTLGLGVVGAISGLVAFRFGLAGVRRLAFPLAFLLFMVPIPPALLNPVIVGLQFVVSAFAVGLLELAGLEVVRQGNVISLADGGSLFVAEACSGITSIVTLLPLGCMLAYFTESETWKRLVIVAAVIPIAMLGNLARVIATVAAADAWGVERATTGSLHDSAGVLTFVLACLLLIGFGSLIRGGRRDAPA